MLPSGFAMKGATSIALRFLRGSGRILRTAAATRDADGNTVPGAQTEVAAVPYSLSPYAGGDLEQLQALYGETVYRLVIPVEADLRSTDIFEGDGVRYEVRNVLAPETPGAYQRSAVVTRKT